MSEVKPFYLKGTENGHLIYSGNHKVAEITIEGIDFNSFSLENFRFSIADLEFIIKQYKDNYQS